jgi:hypothetical protein
VNRPACIDQTLVSRISGPHNRNPKWYAVATATPLLVTGQVEKRLRADHFAAVEPICPTVAGTATVAGATIASHRARPSRRGDPPRPAHRGRVLFSPARRPYPQSCGHERVAGPPLSVTFCTIQSRSFPFTTIPTTSPTITTSVAPGRERHAGKRHLPGARDQRRDVLHLEEEVCGPGLERTARTAAVARRER